MSTQDHIIHDEQELMHELEAHDEWFRHDAAEPHHQEAHGSTNIWVIGGFLAGTVVFVFASAWVLVNMYFLPNIHALKTARQESVAPLSRLYDSTLGGYAAGVSQLQDQWNATLTTGAILDQERQTARVPIESAMRVVIEQYREQSSK